MSIIDEPFNAEKALGRGGCSCGTHKNQAEHDLKIGSKAFDEATILRNRVESSVVRALFPSDLARRNFLKAVGASTALAAISQFFPLGTATEAFAEGAPSKKQISKLVLFRSLAPRPLLWLSQWAFTLSRA